ncbi:mucin-2-like [Cimex lectularius]|uniref:EMI domain-containing protein n=1 Tax=Cimex lectularius TaxID=79782 RepID=A0A8I6RY57_CIMLE|nr:mucin-2-like [Cimex lectularius]
MLFFTVIVSSLIWVTQGTPSGNHTCTGVVKHPVTVRVNVTEPVTYRTYTWCLRVPPRCSKYTIQLQDRVKIHTEMHNRTITVCCKGYVEMDYKCVPACPPQTDCPFMHCNRTNHCYCTPGYTGLYCNDPCERGFWGENCMKECDCPPGYTCHHLTGDCMLDDKRPPSKTRRTTTTTTSEQITSTMPTLTTSMETESKTVSPVVTTQPTTTNTVFLTSQETTVKRVTAPSLPVTPTSSPVSESTNNLTFLITSMAKNATTDASNFETWITSQTETDKKETATPMITSPSTVQSTMVTTRPTDISSSTSTSIVNNSSTVRTIFHSTYPTVISTYPTVISTIISSTFDNTTQENKPFSISTKISTPFESTISPSTTVANTVAPNITGTEVSKIVQTMFTTPGMITSKVSSTTPFHQATSTFTTSNIHNYSVLQTAETTKYADMLSTLLEPDHSHTIMTEPNTKETNIIFTSTSVSSISKTPVDQNTTKRPLSTDFESNEDGMLEGTQTKSTTEKVLYENFPPLIINRKKVESTLGTYTTSFQKETLDGFSSTILPSLVQSLPKGNEKIPASFPHQPKTKQVDKGVKLLTTTDTKPTSTPFILSSPTSLHVPVTTASEPTSDLIQPVHSHDPAVISNSHDSITAKRPVFREKTTTENIPFIDSNKRLWEIFETGLNLKTTMSPARVLRTTTTTTVSPTKRYVIEDLEQYGNLEMPIKKSHVYTSKASSETLSIKTTRPVLDLEKETSTDTPQILKQPKHKEKYQKKHKSKIYDAPSTTTTHQHQTVTENVTFSNTDEKSLRNKSSYSLYKPTESLIESSKTTSNDKEAELPASSESTSNPTSARPSHTWYSHAREKAKIKEALKSLKTTSLLDNSVRPTAAFDNDSNDINMMQTSFTEGKNFKEAEDDKIKELYLKENTINMTRTETQYPPSKITAVNESLFSFDSSTFTLNILCALMFVVVITLLWLHLSKKRKTGRVSPDRRTTANTSQEETVSPTYETVFPLNQCPESLEASTFFGPILTTYYADRINRGLAEMNYDHPRSSNFNQQSAPYAEAQFDYF